MSTVRSYPENVHHAALAAVSARVAVTFVKSDGTSHPCKVFVGADVSNGSGATAYVQVWSRVNGIYTLIASFVILDGTARYCSVGYPIKVHPGVNQGATDGEVFMSTSTARDTIAGAPALGMSVYGAAS